MFKNRKKQFWGRPSGKAGTKFAGDLLTEVAASSVSSEDFEKRPDFGHRSRERHRRWGVLVAVLAAVVVPSVAWANIFDTLIEVEVQKDAAANEVAALRKKIPAQDGELSRIARRSDTAERASKPIQRSVHQTLVNWERAARRNRRASSSNPQRRSRVSRVIKVAFTRSIPKQLQALKVLEAAQRQVAEFHTLLMERAKTTTLLAFESGVVAQKMAERTGLLKGSKHDPQVVKDLDETAARLAEETKTLRDDSGNKDFHRRKGTLRRPVKGEMTYPFGPMKVTQQTSVRHTGQTWKVPVGTEVQATAPGRVIFAKSFPGFGNVIIIDHGSGYTSLYAHLDSFVVKRGDRVPRGTVIAKSGDSGSLDGPKLYFELREEGHPVDPESWYLFK